MTVTVQPRHTKRRTESTSVTSSVGVSPKAVVDEAAIYQARLDLADETLWSTPKRQSYRLTMVGHLITYQNSHELSAKEYEGFYKIFRYNDADRPRAPYDPTAKLPPIPPALLEALRKKRAGEDSAPPAAAAAPTARVVEEPVEEPEPEEPAEPEEEAEEADNCLNFKISEFDPPLSASYIAQGWGFQTATIVERFQREFDDFPDPIPSERAQPRWYWSDIMAWTIKHRADIERARTRKTRTEHTRDTKGNAAFRIAELEARVATLTARLGDSSRG